jgi:integrase
VWDRYSTVARSYRLLRPIFTTAIDDEVLPQNPCKIKGAGDAQATERPTLSLPQVQELTQAMSEHYRALVQLLVWSGIRIGEAAAFQRKDLQLSINTPTLAVWARIFKVKGVFELDTPKSEAGMRTIALPPHLAPIRRKHIDFDAKGDPDALKIHYRST